MECFVDDIVLAHFYSSSLFLRLIPSYSMYPPIKEPSVNNPYVPKSAKVPIMRIHQVITTSM